MQCDICQRSASSRLPFNCTLCARDALYQPRIQLAQTLLHKESLGKEVERSVKGTSQPKKSANSTSSRSTEPKAAWAIERAEAERKASEDATQTLLGHVESLREEMQKAKAEIAERKAKLQKRRSDFASAKLELSQSQANALEPVEKGIRRTEHRWEILHTKTAEARLFLCREAALLYGLQQRERKRGSLGRDVYVIGGVPIPDLRDLNSMNIPINPIAKLTFLRCFFCASHDCDHEPSASCPPSVALPLPSITSRNYSTASRLPIPYHTFPWLILHWSGSPISRLYTESFLE